MALVMCGIDEAGYGPMLGPLCVSACTLRLEGWASGDEPPDFWSLLESAVCKAPRDKKRRIAFADSKRLKLSNQTKTRHPLTHLERGVLCALATAGWSCRSDDELFAALDTALGDDPWFAGPGAPLPLNAEPGTLDIDANLLRAAMGRESVSLVELSVEAIPVDRFNAIIAKRGSKAETTRVAITTLLRRVVRRWLELNDGSSLRVVCDAQGGRTHYLGLVQGAFPKSKVAVVTEQPEMSVYRVEIPNATGDLRLVFQPEAEDAHLPVALASMSAKLVRELAMARFNRYWSARWAERWGSETELKPTAGYVQDARRWLFDAADLVSEQDRARLIRLA